jgi:hypothetical protein
VTGGAYVLFLRVNYARVVSGCVLRVFRDSALITKKLDGRLTLTKAEKACVTSGGPVDQNKRR